MQLSLHSIHAPGVPMQFRFAASTVTRQRPPPAAPLPGPAAGVRHAPHPVPGPEMMLAMDYEPGGPDPSGWLVGEKLDGVRARWDGRQLWSRGGLLYPAPAWFTADLPAVALDGELWAGRGRFQHVCSVVRKKVPIDAEWRGLQFRVFDAPGHPAGFAERLAYAAALLPGGPLASIIPHQVCRGPDNLREIYTAVVEAGGEGIVLRDPGAAYEAGYSPHMLRLVPLQRAEAKVIAYKEGKGAWAGQVAALVCAWQGLDFCVSSGLSTTDRQRPPRRGAMITFSYKGRTESGRPRQPVFIGVRDYE